jgi:DNA-directed RNA polymerase subunit RPC12/RpoP
MGDIRFECSTCGKHLVIDEKGAGMRVRCIDCNSELTVPLPSLPEQTSSMVSSDYDPKLPDARMTKCKYCGAMVKRKNLMKHEAKCQWGTTPGERERLKIGAFERQVDIWKVQLRQASDVYYAGSYGTASRSDQSEAERKMKSIGRDIYGKYGENGMAEVYWSLKHPPTQRNVNGCWAGIASWSFSKYD